MAITHIGTAQIGIAQNGSNVTLTFSTTPSEGDVVILVGGHSVNNTIAPITSGYTAFSTLNDTLSMGAWYKVMGATPDTTVTGAGGGNATSSVVYGSYVLRGVDTSTIPDATATTSGPTTSSGAQNPAITTVTDGAWVVVLMCNGADITQGTVSGYTNTIVGNEFDSVWYFFTAATKEVTTAGTETPGAWSGMGSATWYAVTIAVRPAGGGGGGEDPSTRQIFIPRSYGPSAQPIGGAGMVII